jgi:hypothetical protein
LTAADIGLVLSDRDRLEGAGQVLDYLKLKDQSRTVLYTALDLHYKAETLGQVHILVPAAVLQDLSGEQLDPGPAQDEQGPDEQQSPRGHRAGVLDPEEVAALISEDDEQGIEDPDQVAQAGAGSEPEGQDQGQRQEIEAHALHITLLQATSHIDEELKAFLGKPLELYDYVARVISKRELLKRFQGKIVVTNLALSGDNYGAAYTAVDLEDAIFLGGSLVMLPKAEINRKIQNGQFREDDSDAFGEIINILAGAFSSAFGNYFPQKVRLKKDRMATVAPTKLDVGTDEPFPDGDYFLATYSMRLGSRPLQSFNIFFSPDLFNLSKRDLESLKKNPVAGNSDAEEGPGYTSLQAEGCDVNRPALAVLAEDLKYGDSIASNLDINDVEVCQAKLRDNLREKLRSLDVMGVFLVMRKIDDNSLASLIKIRSFLKGRCPIIIAAPKWDRAKVIKAVHYGASDIICLPTNKETVQSKTRRLMVN